MADKKDYSKNIQRITEMEEKLDRIQSVLEKLSSSLEEYRSISKDIKDLEKYYTGKNWKEDLKLDEEGKLPKDLKRGVLSEDAIYDLLNLDKEISSQLQ